MPRRVCTFAVAHTDISAQPFNNAARTVRIFAPNNLSGSAVYVKFSNYYSDGPVWVGNATIGLADAKGRLVPDTVRPLTVHGDTSFALVPQRDVFSDRVALPVQPGCTIAVSHGFAAPHRHFPLPAAAAPTTASGCCFLTNMNRKHNIQPEIWYNNLKPAACAAARSSCADALSRMDLRTLNHAKPQ